MSVDLWVVRHGQTVFNLENRWQGWADSPLTAEGERQALEAARRLSGVDFQHLIVSPLGRAQQTMDLMVQELKLEHLPLEKDERIKERGVGVLSGVLTKDMASLFPAEMKMRLEDPLNWHPEDGESSWAFIHRVREFAHSCAQRKDLHGPVLVVTHGGVCAQMHAQMLGEDPIYSWELKIPNASISHYQYDSGHWSCKDSDISLRDSSMTWFPS